MQSMRAIGAICAIGALAACPGTSGDTGEGSSTDGGSTSTTAGSTTTPLADTTATDTTATSSGTSDTAAADELPPTPTLASPPDGATDVPVQTSLCWNLALDPDGEPLRYRVFVDGIELSNGIQGEEEGYEGPCAGPLDFAFERTFAWHVQAFEVDEPTRASEPTAPWSFTTVDDGVASTVFEDGFTDDLGWEITGDATSGAWVRTDPVPTAHLGALSQPGRCAGSQGCYVTGQNPGGQPDQADVAGGSTILTSPPFDLEGAPAATVRVQRFFYSSAPAPGPSLRVELLVPDEGIRGGYQAHLLEELADPTADTPENRWTPREYVACGVPMRGGSRLRITATDLGTEILESAIDSVAVLAHDDATVCGTGEGGFCEPSLGATACPDPLLCCPQGSINEGVHRCAAAVPSLDYENPTRSPDDPFNGPLGCDAPDLVIDPSWITPIVTDILVTENTCELYEGCVGGLGWRTIMGFTLATDNIGSRDLVLGVAANEPDLFHYSECHDHHHFDDFADYALLDGAGVVATGHKPGFCLLESYSWAWPNEGPTYDCANQGIGVGYGDLYDLGLPCQWIDVTDVPPGDYMLRAALNQPREDAAAPALVERDYTNNVVEVAVTVP